MISPSWMLNSGTSAAERREAVVHGVDGAARRVGGDGREQRRIGDAEADFLAFHVAAGLQRRSAPGRCASAAKAGLPGCLGPVGDDDAGQEQDAHDREDRPALALVADHAAEHVGERRADREDQHDLDEIGDGVRVLERMGGVGVEEAAAVGAQHLDDFLRGDRALGDHLLGAFQRRRLGIGAEVLRHALPDEEQADDDRDRQQDVERAAGQIDPEIADAVCAERRAKPRTSAIASAMPVAAETKLCTVSPAIWTR